MTNDTQKLLQPIARSRAGRIVIDNRGRNVWQWKDVQIDSTSIVLKRLENDALQLEPTRNVPIPKKVAKHKAATAEHGSASYERPGLSISATLSYKVGGGFDPYNRS
jgi:hypothetical protein